MAYSNKRKKPTVVHFSPAPAASSSVPASTSNVLREKTTIRQDGTTRQKRSMVSVVDEHAAPKARDDVRTPSAPIYEPFTAADHAGDDYDDDEGGRDLRDSDDPLRQWAEDHRDTFLEEMLRHEGRGDHAELSACPRCRQREGDHRCTHCFGGGELLCESCVVAGHRQLPFHPILYWTGSTFQRKTLKEMGLRIQLGHWHQRSPVCPLPQPASGNDFVIIDSHGVHAVNLDFCGCGRGGLPTVQLLRAGLWPATTTNPRTAATFSVLRRYHLLSFESKCAALEFYQSLARESDNLHYKKNKDRYHEFLRMTRQWRNVQMLKRAGRGHDPCPHPGINLPQGWEQAPEDKRFLYALFVGIDANFRLKRKDVSSEEKDPGLGDGWAFSAGSMSNATCQAKLGHKAGAHDAVDKPDREARGTASSGIGTVDCARHNMKRPNAVGICSWESEYSPSSPQIPSPCHIEACNLKYSFNLTRFVGQTDGEAPERGWADANPLARSTKEMGPGFRRDTLDDHFNDWNYKKIIALGHTMRRKIEKAVPEMVRTRQALDDLNVSLGERVVANWTDMAELWEKRSPTQPFETIRKDQHIAHVRAELAAEAAAREAAGQEDEDSIRGDMHITELIAMGLQLEDQQRVLGSDVAATGLHPTDGQRRAMIERTSKLRRKIFAWTDIQHKFFPALGNVRAREDEARARAACGEAIPGVQTEVGIRSGAYLHEYRLRVAQATQALHDVRRLLLVRTHLYKLKDTHSRGVRANMRSLDKIAALNDQIKRVARAYRAARVALVSLGKEVKHNEWERTLLPLAEDDVRGLPQTTFHDPERKSKKKRRKKAKMDRPLSWIWATRGEDWDPGSDVAMNEAVRIEWAKTRARAMRWEEEVDLLEEEMRRIQQFLQWRSDWWRARVNGRGLAPGPQQEGEAAYAIRQASIQSTLAMEFAKEWEGLGDLIRQGREGKLAEDDQGDVGDAEDMDGDEDVEDDSGEEEESIPKLPSRTVKATYVDEVLDM
ncbi:hypothetical protein B0H12DRAFT_1242227 [Mycena haematopus]|nr:hypothetical protein B0H12DRAFT_1242227 [Mycena haematopus]